jgi:hypothetical protein
MNHGLMVSNIQLKYTLKCGLTVPTGCLLTYRYLGMKALS